MSLAIFCSGTDRFVSDLVRNPEHMFSPDVAQSMIYFSSVHKESKNNTFYDILCQIAGVKNL